jgi:uncharacterized cupin superfamily protein
MGYTTVNAAAMKPAPGPHPAASPYDKGIGEALGVRGFGLYQVELPPGGQTVRHDHVDDGAEDVYAVVRGNGAVVVDDQEVPVGPGAFIAVTPESARHVRAGKAGLIFIAVCTSTMRSRDVVTSFWAAMRANDWEAAAGRLAPDCVIDWPCSGERIVGRADFAAVQARYPTTTGHWSFDVHRIVGDAETVVSEVTVTDGEQSARLVSFSQIAGDQIVRQVEYWPTAYDPLPGREDLTAPIERIP